MSKKFQKNVEDFVCEKCGAKVKGSGYTNHCPECLWSKHVDNNPGDREATCGGMMKPFWIEKEGNKFFVYQRCEKCEHEKRNFIGTDDNFDAAVEIMKQEANKFATLGQAVNNPSKKKRS